MALRIGEQNPDGWWYSDSHGYLSGISFFCKRIADQLSLLFQCFTVLLCPCIFWITRDIKCLTFIFGSEIRRLLFSIPNGEMLEGSLPGNKVKLALAWIELHQEELMANWQLAVTGNPIYPIEPLR